MSIQDSIHLTNICRVRLQPGSYVWFNDSTMNQKDLVPVLLELQSQAKRAGCCTKDEVQV